MSYLARLKTLLHEKHLLEELTKPTKGASVSFVSDHGSPFCVDEAPQWRNARASRPIVFPPFFVRLVAGQSSRAMRRIGSRMAARAR